MHGLHQRQEGQIEAQHLVLGMAHDPGNLVGMQARVDGVQHPARTAHAKVHLHVAVAIPCQAGHAVAMRQAQRLDGIRQLLGAVRQRTVGVAVDIAFDAARDDFGVAMVARGKIDQR